MTTALTFNEVTLSPVTHENRLWIRAAELARALGYAREELVSRIFQRHADEFTPDMTQVIEIVAEHQNGVLGNGRTRIFSPRGCHLIAMFARTKVAKAFRRWVLDVLDKVCQPQPEAIPQATTPSTAESRKPLRALVHAWSQVTGVHHAALWPQVKAHFQLTRIDDLPEEWLPDALAFVQGKIDNAGRTDLPSGSRSEIPDNRPQAVPADALDAMTDSQRAKRFRGLLREVQGLAKKVGSTMNMVRLTTHPGARMLSLPPELNARYNALDQMHKLAVAGLYQAEHTLYCLYYMGEGVKFV